MAKERSSRVVGVEVVLRGDEAACERALCNSDVVRSFTREGWGGLEGAILVQCENKQERKRGYIGDQAYRLQEHAETSLQGVCDARCQIWTCGSVTMAQ